ncbi:MAG: FecR domain-containing protein [Beijerinckiaceae bacterium]
MALAFAPKAAFAQDPIGGVESLRNQVTRAGSPIRLGDRVFQNEVIATGSDSSARIAFLDQTNLAIGPTSRVTLDRFVYNAAQQGMAINISQGAFRFTTGNINKAGVRINTPTATMGVRGSVVNINVGPNNSSFTLLDESEGVWVCPRRRYEQDARRPNESEEDYRRRIGCKDLTRPGDTANVDNRGNITQSQQSPTQFGLNGQCSANPTLCGGLQQFAGVPPFANAPFFFLGALLAGGGAIAVINSDNNNAPLSP